MSTTHFPAVGHVYEANFGSWVHHLHFESETVMTLTTAEGPFKGTSETVQIAVTPIRPRCLPDQLAGSGQDDGGPRRGFRKRHRSYQHH